MICSKKLYCSSNSEILEPFQAGIGRPRFFARSGGQPGEIRDRQSDGQILQEAQGHIFNSLATVTPGQSR